MSELLLIRHGETAWNAERRLQGHTDIPLNPAGLRQAQALATALADQPIDTILCSDLQRARQTAQAIAEPRGLCCQTGQQWRERAYGGFEGELIDRLPQLYPSEYTAWRACTPDARFPVSTRTGSGGETLREFHSRVEQALLDLATRYPDQTIVLVAHGGVLECAWRIAHRLALETPRQTTMKNASINRFRLELEGNLPALHLLEWGAATHLDGALDEIHH